MPALQVRDLPQDIHAQLQDLAKREHRSIAQQTIIMLQEYLNHSENFQGESGHKSEREQRIEHRQEIFTRIDDRRLSEQPDDFPRAAELVREDRDSR